MNPCTRRAISVAKILALALAHGASDSSAQVVYPLAGAPYSAGAMAPAGATLAIIGGIEGRGADVAAASTDALSRMEARLAEVGLDRNHVLRVRAALAPGSGDGSEFTAWDGSWTRFFSSGHLPARVTVGSSAVPGDARVVLDLVALFPGESGFPSPVAGSRQTLNPNVRLAGPAANPTSVVSTRAGLFLSSGVLPGLGGLTDPESMIEQIRATMNSLTSILAGHGLQWHDVFFVRVLPTPQPARATVDLPAWTPVFEDLGRMTGGNAPAFALWAAPGFSASGRYVEVEVWAVPHAPHPLFQVIDMEMQNPLLRMTGSGGAIAGGALIAPNAELVFLSGVVAPAGTAPENEGAAALDLMRERLAAMGASMADVAELRVYRLAGEAGFNTAYGTHFNNAETSPHRPVRTNYLVQGLPGGRSVEIEAVVVRPPRRF